MTNTEQTTPPRPRAAQSDAVRELLDRARGGDELAGGQLLSGFERYLTLLARVQVGRRVQGKVDPADLVQEVFLEAHRQIKNFRGTTEAELLAWLRRILAGQIALMLRRYLGTKGRDVTLERDLAGQLDESSQAMGNGLAAAGSSPSQHVAKREQAVLLADALDKLSDSYREVIVLRHLEGLTFPQVAARMGRSEDSVQKLWVRALAGLRQKLGGSA
jgi:RNA polymerase sigma-70 factor (ECF subfamily)